MLLNLFKLQKCCHTDQAHWVLFVKLSLSYKKKSKKKKERKKKDKRGFSRKEKEAFSRKKPILFNFNKT